MLGGLCPLLVLYIRMGLSQEEAVELQMLQNNQVSNPSDEEKSRFKELQKKQTLAMKTSKFPIPIPLDMDLFQVAVAKQMSSTSKPLANYGYKKFTLGTKGQDVTTVTITMPRIYPAATFVLNGLIAVIEKTMGETGFYGDVSFFSFGTIILDGFLTKFDVSLDPATDARTITLGITKVPKKKSSSTSSDKEPVAVTSATPAEGVSL